MTTWPWMPGWSTPTARDLEVAEVQLGRPLGGLVVAIARRCRFGQPQALVTSALLETADPAAAPVVTPFPTLFWLTCPRVREAVGALENAGMIRQMRERLRVDEDFRREYAEANSDYARRRLAVLEEADPAWRDKVSVEMAKVITSAGVGGLVDPEGVKCIHMHVAHWLATANNPVGREAVAAMGGEGGPATECADGRCLLR